MVAYQVIGKPTPRIEGPEKVTGAAKYAADYSPPGTVWGKCVHSPYPYARIVSIDTSKAKALPGVHAVITGEDTREGGPTGLWGRGVKDAPVLAYQVVRFAGERVAAVAADDRDIAQQACDLIEVEYEPMEPVLHPFDALKPDAPILHPNFNDYIGFRYKQDHPENVHLRQHYERGDVEKGFADADLVVENTYETNRQSQAAMEPQGLVVDAHNADGRVHVWHCNKVPHYTRGALAVVAGIPDSQIVFEPVFIGGDFGMKGNSRLTGICYYLSRYSGRPVRMVDGYIEEFQAGNPRHHVIAKIKTGVKKDGTITAIKVDYTLETGAYAAFKSYGGLSGANQALGPYRAENVLMDSTFVYTNNIPGGFMRAPGEPQGVWVCESNIDEVARKLGIDPVEFRRKNLVVGEEETAWGESFHFNRVGETMEAAVEGAGYFDSRPRYVGKGVAIGDRGQGGGTATVDITLHPDGGATIGTPVFDQGSGVYTVLAQMVGEELGVPISKIKIDVWNSDAVETDSGMAGSHSTRIQTVVGYEASQEVKRHLVEIAHRVLEWPDAATSVTRDQIQNSETGESMPWSDLLARANEDAHGRAGFNDNTRHEITGFVAQVAEVEIDPDTGQIKVLNFTTAHDAGRIVNPIGFYGQIYGGVANGLGFALTEDVVVEDGHVVTGSFGDYKIPTMPDMPPLKTIVLDSEDGVGPYHIRGIGEASCIPTAPAIANAIEDAIGVRIRDLPITAEKVYNALHNGGQ